MENKMNTVEAKTNLPEENTLQDLVDKTSPLKEWLVAYAGEKKNPENDEVTLEMIVETMSEEFPEFLLAIAEENWIRGYHQALDDVETGQKLYNEHNQKLNAEEE